MDVKSAGKRLRQRREELALTQYDLQRVYGDDESGKPVLPQQQVQRIESGIYKSVSLQDACNIAKVLRMDIRTFAAWYGLWDVPDGEELAYKIAGFIQTLPKSEQEGIVTLVESVVAQYQKKLKHQPSKR